MKKILIISVLLYIVFTMTKVKSEDIRIPNKSIRFRIVANSNNEYDQLIKMNLSIKIEQYLIDILKDTKDIADASRIINENMKNIDMIIENYLKANNYNTKYQIVFGENLFPEKKYNGVIYEKGYYKSLVVTLGSGMGRNWWCVLFPPLCLMEAQETDNNKIEYHSYIKEILNKYL